MNTPAGTQRNIEAIVRLEEEYREQRSRAERITDLIASFAGSLWSVGLHVAWFTGWFLINTDTIPGIPAFDPYPFILLTLMVSAEAVLLSTFVLMKQNRMSMRADQRAHLNLQIDLLAEEEITKILQLQRRLCERFGLRDAADDTEVRELSQRTAVEKLAKELQRKLPDSD